MDNTHLRNSPDSKRINVNEHHEVQYWTKTLDISEAQLRDAVKVAGTSAEKVREHLNKH